MSSPSDSDGYQTYSSANDADDADFSSVPPSSVTSPTSGNHNSHTSLAGLKGRSGRLPALPISPNSNGGAGFSPSDKRSRIINKILDGRAFNSSSSTHTTMNSNGGDVANGNNNIANMNMNQYTIPSAQRSTPARRQRLVRSVRNDANNDDSDGSGSAATGVGASADENENTAAVRSNSGSHSGRRVRRGVSANGRVAASAVSIHPMFLSSSAAAAASGSSASNSPLNGTSATAAAAAAAVAAGVGLRHHHLHPLQGLHGPPSFFGEGRVVLHLAKTKYRILRRVARMCKMNTIEIDEGLQGSEDFNVLWGDTIIPLDRLRKFQPWQHFNHFASMFNITRKHNLSLTMGKMQSVIPHHYTFAPRSWSLKTDRESFEKYFSELKSFELPEEERKVFIMKPNSGCQGKGIVLSRDPLKEVETPEDYVVQEYISRPLLIDGRKFDLRVYCLVSSMRYPSIHVFNEGLVRLCAEPYEMPNADNMANSCKHLTNFAVNKKSEAYQKATTQGDVGSKRNFVWFNKWIDEMIPCEKDNNNNNDKKYHSSSAKMWADIDDIIVRTVLAAQPKVRHTYNVLFPPQGNDGYTCFEVLGFDILIDAQMRPWLMEVNHTPSFVCGTQMDLQVKSALIKEVMTMINPTPDDRSNWFARRQMMQQRGAEGGGGQNANVVGKTTRFFMASSSNGATTGSSGAAASATTPSTDDEENDNPRLQKNSASSVRTDISPLVFDTIDPNEPPNLLGIPINTPEYRAAHDLLEDLRAVNFRRVYPVPSEPIPEADDTFYFEKGTKKANDNKGDDNDDADDVGNSGDKSNDGPTNNDAASASDENEEDLEDFEELEEYEEIEEEADDGTVATRYVSMGTTRIPISSGSSKTAKTQSSEAKDKTKKTSNHGANKARKVRKQIESLSVLERLARINKDKARNLLPRDNSVPTPIPTPDNINHRVQATLVASKLEHRRAVYNEILIHAIGYNAAKKDTLTEEALQRIENNAPTEEERRDGVVGKYGIGHGFGVVSGSGFDFYSDADFDNDEATAATKRAMGQSRREEAFYPPPSSL